MRAKHCCGVVVAAGIVCGFGADLPGGFGVNEAAAASGQTRVYTRKRVHGRWITGRFTEKVGAHSTRLAAGTRSTKPTATSHGGQAAPRPPERFAALETDPAAVAPGAPASAGSSQADPTSRRGMLQKALETRAQELAHVSKPTEAPTAQPRSVSFDFESGLKTTVFPDDRVVREGFDVAAAQTLASKPPETPASPLPKP